MLTKKNKIAVICGGWNCEKEVSLSSGQNVHKTLKDAGYNSILIDVDRDIVKKLYDIKPDIVFNALHGRFGEDGRMTAILDLLEIPVTHCSILPSAIAMNKIKTKELCSNIGGLGNIDFAILKKNNNAENKAILNKFPKPFVIKPVSEGSSCGIYMIDEEKKINIDDLDWSYGDELLIEKYINGQEVSVVIFRDEAIGVIEVKPKNKFYDYESKYIAKSEYIVPANIDKIIYDKIMHLALQCHKKINCEFISRVDMIIDKVSNKAFLLEINTHPGMTSCSLVPKVAQYQGISFLELIIEMLNYAKSKKEKSFS